MQKRLVENGGTLCPMKCDYAKIQNDFVAGDVKHFSVTIPAWLHKMVQESDIDAAQAMRAALATLVGVDYDKVHCNRSKLFNEPIPA